LGIAALLTVKGPAQKDEPPPDPTPREGVEVEARGPVHEAYAEPSESRPEPTIVAPKQPPDPINEIPPDQKPADEHVVWIPGYWGWDDDAKDYLWISGFWRVAPPKRQWVPGNWQQVEGGWQWTPGFWAPENLEQVDYLPAPPPSLDEGPSTAAPDEDSIYSPGTWVYRERRYYWRPGFWVPFRAGWVWIPAHYIWSPIGYVFIDGYWDRPLAERGLLFAPVRIHRDLLVADWVYVPSYCVQPDFLLSAFFVRPGYCHYYFGDWFEDGYRKRGFVTWLDFRIGRDSFDPNFAYYRHAFGDRSWEQNMRAFYDGRFKGDIPRPPRTLVQQNTVIKDITVNKTQNVAVSKNINITNIQNVTAVAPVTKINDTKVTQLAGLSKTAPQKIEPHVLKVETMPKAQSEEVRKAVTHFREASHQRQQTEGKILKEGGAPVKPTDPPKSMKIELPKSPAPVPPSAPKAPPVKEPPKPPTPPKHEDRTPPQHEPPKPPAPPKNPVAPKEPPKPPVKEPPPPPKDSPKPPPKEPPPKEPPPKEPPPKEPPPKEPPPKDHPKPPPKEPPSKDQPKPPGDKDKPGLRP
jgi:hypothetical protein